MSDDDAPRSTRRSNPTAVPHQRRLLGRDWQEPAEWLALAWAAWWLWAYVQTALAQRFPQWLGWTTRLW